MAAHQLHGPATPFDRAADASPLLEILVDLDHVSSQDAEAAARVLALGELSFLSVRGRRDGDPIGTYDLRVVSRAPSDVVTASGIVTPVSALDLVRVLLVNRGLFYLRGGITVNEGFYYLYRFKWVFRAYQQAWTVATFARATLGEAVQDQLSSLGTRLNFLCRAADRGAYAAQQRANNDTEVNVLYHLAYFVMLATGVFDDLAWTLTHLYKLPSHRRNHVVLKFDAGKNTSPFLDALGAAAPAVAARVAGAQVQGILRIFYPVRDRLQHRQFLRGLLYLGGPWAAPKILFEFPEDAIQPIRDASTDRRGTEWGLGLASDAYVDPYAFLTRGIAAVAEVHEAIIGAVDWAALAGPTGDPVREKVDESLAHYERGLAAFLHWPAEPLYF